MSNNDKKPSIGPIFTSGSSEGRLSGDALLARILPDEPALTVHMLVREYTKTARHEDKAFGQKIAAVLEARLENDLCVATDLQEIRNCIYYTTYALKSLGYPATDDFKTTIKDRVTKRFTADIDRAGNMLDALKQVNILCGTLKTIGFEPDAPLQQAVFGSIKKIAEKEIAMSKKTEAAIASIGSYAVRALSEIGMPQQDIAAFYSSLPSATPRPAPSQP